MESRGDDEYTMSRPTPTLLPRQPPRCEAGTNQGWNNDQVPAISRVAPVEKAVDSEELARNSYAAAMKAITRSRKVAPTFKVGHRVCLKERPNMKGIVEDAYPDQRIVVGWDSKLGLIQNKLLTHLSHELINLSCTSPRNITYNLREAVDVFDHGKWFPAKITKRNPNGTYKIEWADEDEWDDDGDAGGMEEVHRTYIRKKGARYQTPVSTPRSPNRSSGQSSEISVRKTISFMMYGKRHAASIVGISEMDKKGNVKVKIMYKTDALGGKQPDKGSGNLRNLGKVEEVTLNPVAMTLEDRYGTRNIPFAWGEGRAEQLRSEAAERNARLVLKTTDDTQYDDLYDGLVSPDQSQLGRDTYLKGPIQKKVEETLRKRSEQRVRTPPLTRDERVRDLKDASEPYPKAAEPSPTEPTLREYLSYTVNEFGSSDAEGALVRVSEEFETDGHLTRQNNGDTKYLLEADAEGCINAFEEGPTPKDDVAEIEFEDGIVVRLRQQDFDKLKVYTEDSVQDDSATLFSSEEAFDQNDESHVDIEFHNTRIGIVFEDARVVSKVTPNTQAALKGVQSGWVATQINQRPISSKGVSYDIDKLKTNTKVGDIVITFDTSESAPSLERASADSVRLEVRRPRDAEARVVAPSRKTSHVAEDDGLFYELNYAETHQLTDPSGLDLTMDLPEKMEPPEPDDETIADDLSQTSSVQASYEVGDKVEVWSESKEKWFKDGQIISIQQHDGGQRYIVCYNAGHSKKVISDDMIEVLRPATSQAKDASSEVPLSSARGSPTPDPAGGKFPTARNTQIPKYDTPIITRKKEAQSTGKRTQWGEIFGNSIPQLRALLKDQPVNDSIRLAKAQVTKHKFKPNRSRETKIHEIQIYAGTK